MLARFWPKYLYGPIFVHLSWSKIQVWVLKPANRAYSGFHSWKCFQMFKLILFLKKKSFKNIQCVTFVRMTKSRVWNHLRFYFELYCQVVPNIRFLLHWIQWFSHLVGIAVLGPVSKKNFAIPPGIWKW